MFLVSKASCFTTKEFIGYIDSVSEYDTGEKLTENANKEARKILEQAKKEAEMKANAPAPKIEGLAPIEFNDFMKVELRVAEVKNCEPIKKAKKLLKLTLDDGTGTDRIVASGIAKWYKPEDLIGKKVIVVANLKPAVLCGVESCGMILAADSGDTVKVVFVDDMEVGSTVR